MKTKVIRGTSVPKSELTSYSVGLARLKESHILSCNFAREDIEFIGQCSISQQKVILGKIGNTWVISGRTSEVQTKRLFQTELRFRAYYVIEGKKVTVLRTSVNMSARDAMKAYEFRDTSKPLRLMNHTEVFQMAKGRRPSRKQAPKMSLQTRLAYAAIMERKY